MRGSDRVTSVRCGMRGSDRVTRARCGMRGSDRVTRAGCGMRGSDAQNDHHFFMVIGAAFIHNEHQLTKIMIYFDIWKLAMNSMKLLSIERKHKHH